MVTVQVKGVPRYHGTIGVARAVVTTPTDGIAQLTITLQLTRFRTVRADNTDGIVSAETDVLPMMRAANGLIKLWQSTIWRRSHKSGMGQGFH